MKCRNSFNTKISMKKGDFKIMKEESMTTITPKNFEKQFKEHLKTLGPNERNGTMGLDAAPGA